MSYYALNYLRTKERWHWTAIRTLAQWHLSSSPTLLLLLPCGESNEPNENKTSKCICGYRCFPRRADRFEYSVIAQFRISLLDHDRWFTHQAFIHSRIHFSAKSKVVETLRVDSEIKMTGVWSSYLLIKISDLVLLRVFKSKLTTVGAIAFLWGV